MGEVKGRAQWSPSLQWRTTQRGSLALPGWQLANRWKGLLRFKTIAILSRRQLTHAIRWSDLSPILQGPVQILVAQCSGLVATTLPQPITEEQANARLVALHIRALCTPLPRHRHINLLTQRPQTPPRLLPLAPHSPLAPPPLFHFQCSHLFACT